MTVTNRRKYCKLCCTAFVSFVQLYFILENRLLTISWPNSPQNLQIPPRKPPTIHGNHVLLFAGRSLTLLLKINLLISTNFIFADIFVFLVWSTVLLICTVRVIFYIYWEKTNKIFKVSSLLPKMWTGFKQGKAGTCWMVTMISCSGPVWVLYWICWR